jgi:hypothetical protein
MKKWMYVIFPGAMLALFLIAYVAEGKRRTEREAAHTAEVARLDKDKQAKEATMKAKAEADAKKRSDERAAIEKKKEDDRVAKWTKEGQDIQADLDRSNAAIDQQTKEVAQMEKNLFALREARERGNREFLEAMKRAEMAQIDRRTSELEIDRLLKLINQRATDVTGRALTPPAAPPRRTE